MLEELLDDTGNSFSGEEVIVKGVGGGSIVPLHFVHLRTGYVSGEVKIGVSCELPVPGVHVLLGNDLAGDKVVPELMIVNDPTACHQKDVKCTEGKESSTVVNVNNVSCVTDEHEADLYPACVVTRAMSKRSPEDEQGDGDVSLGEVFTE